MVWPKRDTQADLSEFVHSQRLRALQAHSDSDADADLDLDLDADEDADAELDLDLDFATNEAQDSKRLPLCGPLYEAILCPPTYSNAPLILSLC